MKKELQDKLFEKYPKIFKQKDFSIQDSCMSWGITCGNGWYNLINTLCAQIEHRLLCYNNQAARRAKKNKKAPPVLLTFEATQVKEKFGGLRFYHGDADDVVRGLVTMAESMSYHICDICGNEGSPRHVNDNNWLATRCGKHKSTHWYVDIEKWQGSVAIDFDGVINSYKSGFVAIDNIPDPPVEGAFEFIEELLKHNFQVYIFSTRNGDPKGIEAIKSWLIEHGMSKETLDRLDLATGKPIAKVYIDDRAWEFRGKWPSVQEIAGFKPWHGGKSSSQK